MGSLYHSFLCSFLTHIQKKSCVVPDSLGVQRPGEVRRQVVKAARVQTELPWTAPSRLKVCSSLWSGCSNGGYPHLRPRWSLHGHGRVHWLCTSPTLTAPPERWQLLMAFSVTKLGVQGWLATIASLSGQYGCQPTLQAHVCVCAPSLLISSAENCSGLAWG